MPGRLGGECSPAGQGLTGAGSKRAERSGRSPDGTAKGSRALLSSDHRKPCPLETRCWPPATPASGARSVRSSGRPTGQPRPRPGGWPRVETAGLGGRGTGPILPSTSVCPQPTRGHGPGRRGDLHQRLGQPPRATQSPRQGGSGDHGYHQGRRWAAMLEHTCRGPVPRPSAHPRVPGAHAGLGPHNRHRCPQFRPALCKRALTRPLGSHVPDLP